MPRPTPPARPAPDAPRTRRRPGPWRPTTVRGCARTSAGFQRPSRASTSPKSTTAFRACTTRLRRVIARRVEPAGKVLGAQEQRSERLVDAHPRRGEGGDDLRPAQPAEGVVVEDVDVVVEIDEPVIEHRRERKPRQRRQGHGDRHRHVPGNRDRHRVVLGFDLPLPVRCWTSPAIGFAPRHGKFIREGDSSRFLVWREPSLWPRVGAQQPPFRTEAVNPSPDRNSRQSGRAEQATGTIWKI